MSKLVAGLLALVTLAVCILGNIDPVTTTTRALLAFVMGWTLGGMWDGITGKKPESGKQRPNKKAKKSKDTEQEDEADESAEVEPDPDAEAVAA